MERVFVLGLVNVLTLTSATRKLDTVETYTVKIQWVASSVLAETDLKLSKTTVWISMNVRRRISARKMQSVIIVSGVLAVLVIRDTKVSYA